MVFYVPKDIGVSKLINEFVVLLFPIESCFSSNSNIISDDDGRVSGAVLVDDNNDEAVVLFKYGDSISEGSRLFETISLIEPPPNTVVVWMNRFTTSGIGTIS